MPDARVNLGAARLQISQNTNLATVPSDDISGMILLIILFKPMLLVLIRIASMQGFFLQFWEGALGPFRLGKLTRYTTKLGNFLNKQ